ncbi:hypothetical protein BKI52_12510 [marine bacterium AO1-C]|nr:hypothetical protein BKI52_12510 [marine bacterium AO1-C]
MENLGNTLLPGFNSSEFFVNEKQFDFLFDTIFCEWFFDQSEKKQTWLLEQEIVTSVNFLRKQKKRWWVGGRGSGKTNSIGKLIAQLFFNLPRALFNFLSVSFKQIEGDLLPELRTSLEQMGLIEGIHWQYGKNTIPKNWKDKNGHFKGAYYQPEDLGHCMVFCNGFTIEFRSAEQKEAATRGGNIDGLIVDEAAFLNPEMIRKMSIRVRANGSKAMADNPLHWLIAVFSSAPTTLAGQWLWDKEEVAEQNPLNAYFAKSTAFDNLAGLGGLAKGLAYIQNLYDELTRAEYMVEVLNQALAKPENTFYPTYNEDRHAQDVDMNAQGNYADYDPSLPIHISFDFNKAFMCCVVAQHDTKTNELRIIDKLFVKWREIDDLVEKFCEKYKAHSFKSVYVYGDPNGFKKVDQLSDKSYYDLIVDTFKVHKWNTQVKAINSNINHDLKFLVIKRVLAEANPHTTRVRINKKTCKALITSILLAPRTIEGKKDKSSEKMTKANRDKQERATHLSDAFDYLIYVFYAATILLNMSSTQQTVRKTRGSLTSNLK